ncbi:hypothetical protein M768_11645 [Cellulosimicrobium cellulans F16]|uniref:Uncharacterized protein n=1 Tax=Cellulosimicrobium cellulans F16 TaxID=1350482 RepID=A0A0M0F7Z7_CELCE|nr:hypothetical protein M768_11645 [Cellulosimicrobium cellulans F16]
MLVREVVRWKAVRREADGAGSAADRGAIPRSGDAETAALP